MYKNLRLVYITTKDELEAKNIGRKLVEDHLAACVNILPGMRSFYRWEGKVEESQECVLIAKTHYSRMKELTDAVQEMHSYDCPCVVSFTLTEGEGNPEYLEWLVEESKDYKSIEL